MKQYTAIILVLTALLLPSIASADGLIVPIRPEIRVSGHWAVDYHHVDIRVRDQVASVSIDQKFSNTGRGMIEVEYFFPVPPGAAIDSMTLIVNGKEFAARLLKADEARKIYEDIVRKKKDPALLEYAGFGLYRTRAFPLMPKTPARVQVTYKYVCKKDNGIVEVWYPLNTEKFSAKKVSDVRVTTDIKTKSDITTIYSPSHEIKCKKKDANQAIVTYEGKDVLPTTDFQLFYKATEGDVGATLLTHQPNPKKDGYFLLLVSPNPKLAKKDRVQPKDVVIVFDHSGSMSGTKIKQAKAAVEYVLLRLNEKDRFNVIPYSDTVEPIFDSLMSAGKENFKVAIDEIDRIDAGGGTAINDALATAMEQWPKKGGKGGGRPKYIIFLTDGKPTIGKTNITEILRDAKKANHCKARIFAFGVGYNVNIKLLDKLVKENSGRSDYVKPKESVEAKLASLYNKIRNPVVTNLEVDLQDLKIKNFYPRDIGDLFDGDQIVLAGRYSCSDVKKLPKRAKGIRSTQLMITGMCQGKKKVFEYDVDIRDSSKRRGWDFVEKIWAVRRVGYLMDQIQLNGKSDELVDELVRLSKRYGIMTPYTSFLADETTVLHKPATVRAKASRSFGRLEKAEADAEGQRSAMMRKSLNEATIAPADAAAPTAPAMKSVAGGKGRGGGGVMYGNSSQASYESKKKDRVGSVRNVGNQALYQRGRVWVAANASEVDIDDTAKVKTIKRYSEEYFKLSQANSEEENKIFASQADDEELVISLRGQIYRIK